MSFQQFEILGNEIRARFKEKNFDEAAFADLAADALYNADLNFDFQLDQLADFFLTTTVSQQPSTKFSNLPPIVYRCEEFYIELLVWMDATTAIHQHSFSGAFRVLKGSSFHSTYEFKERERVSSRMLLGDALFKTSEILQTGDIKPIHSGRSGLLHALFHLERPSVTLVVRNAFEPWAAPQYSLSLPHVAYAAHELSGDPTVQLLGRLLGVAAGIDQKQAVDLFIEKVPLLDFPRLFMMFQNYHSYLGSNSDLQRFFESARGIHGYLVDHLHPLLEASRRNKSLTSARNSVTDPDLRLFLALLLNLPTRTSIYKMVQQRFPKEEPDLLCSQWLKRLCNEENTTSAFFELAKKARIGSDRFGAKLKAAVPFSENDPRTEAVFRAVANNEPLESGKVVNKGNSSSFTPSLEDVDAYQRLKQFSELAPLFIS